MITQVYFRQGVGMIFRDSTQVQINRLSIATMWVDHGKCYERVLDW